MKRYLKSLWRFIYRENLHRLLIILVILVFVSSVGIHYFEPDISPMEGIWWSIVTLTTVGYGDISPATIGGQIIAVVIMFFGIGVLGMLSGILASVLVEQKIKADRGMSSYQFDNHIILCEWNFRAKAILYELRLDSQAAETPIVLIADIENKPVDDENLFFINGDVIDETLHRANLAQAKTVIILGNDHLNATERDAKVVLSTLTVESINKDVYTIVELANEVNVKHCERANADEIIVNSELSSGLISRAAVNHGISKVISELLSATHGHEIYKVPVLPRMAGRQFLDVFMDLKKTHDSTIVAIQQHGGMVLSNPTPTYQIQADDSLILIAEEKPNLV